MRMHADDGEIESENVAPDGRQAEQNKRNDRESRSRPENRVARAGTVNRTLSFHRPPISEAHKLTECNDRCFAISRSDKKTGKENW